MRKIPDTYLYYNIRIIFPNGTNIFMALNYENMEILRKSLGKKQNMTYDTILGQMYVTFKLK